MFLLVCKPNINTEENSLKISIDSDPSSIDPIYAVDLTSQKINTLLFVKLFKFSKDGKVEGELAKEYSIQKMF